MNEARRRRNYRKELLEKHPWCIYCGGTTSATEVDHIPARMMFRNKYRPPGLEVPSCSACNRGSSKFEVVAHLFGRVNFGPPNADDEREFSQLLRDAEANNPGFVKELNPTDADLNIVKGLGLPIGSGAFAVNGPIVTNAINRFAAKLGFALHWIETGRIVPCEGAVITRWYSNYNKMTGAFPEDLMKILGEHKTLAQGRFSVADRFVYRTAIADTQRMAIYLSAFAFAFATISFATEDLSVTAVGAGSHVFRPGFIREGAAVSTIVED